MDVNVVWGFCLLMQFSNENKKCRKWSKIQENYCYLDFFCSFFPMGSKNVILMKWGERAADQRKTRHTKKEKIDFFVVPFTYKKIRPRHLFNLYFLSFLFSQKKFVNSLKNYLHIIWVFTVRSRYSISCYSIKAHCK